ncbi:SDR family NAD(P)-dependent oxidoreductase, partial [Amycolatopsis sp. NPDC004368]
SSQVDWSAGAVRLVTEQRPWPETGRPRRAAVSSFGISGTNAHVIIEQPSALESTADEPTLYAGHDSDAAGVSGEFPGSEMLPWVVSGRSPAAVSAQAARLREWLRRSPETTAAEVGLSLASTRALFDHRAVVVGASSEELLAGLDAVASEAVRSGVTRGVAKDDGGGVGFVFSGQGSQWPGMGRGLYEAFPAYARAWDHVTDTLEDLLGVSPSLREVVWAAAGSPEAELLDQTAYAQPALFAVEVALVRLLKSWGVRPSHVLGHSVGEIAAAWASGLLSLEDACRLVVARSRLMQQLPLGGAMVSVEASEEEIAGTLPEGVSIAAVNGPAAAVIAGDEEAVLQVARSWEERDRRTKRLMVSHAFHSSRMDPMLDEFMELAAELTFAEPSVPMISTVYGRFTDAEVSTAEYWARNVREPVRFADGVAVLRESGVSRVLEIGPDSTLTALIASVIGSVGEATVAPMLRRDRDEPATSMHALAVLIASGAEADWHAVYGPAATLALPTYAFQRQRYWPDSIRGISGVSAAGLTEVSHPLLGAATPLPRSGGILFLGKLARSTHPWLADHAVRDAVLLPATAFVEMLFHAANEVGCDVVDELTLHRPLVLPEHGAVTVQVLVDGPEPDGSCSATVYAGSGSEWAEHATAVLSTSEHPAVAPMGDSWPPVGGIAVDLAGFYEEAERSGLTYGPVFRGLRTAWRKGSEVFVEASLTEAAGGTPGGFGLHPALFDSILQAGMLIAPGRVALPFAFQGLRLYATGAKALRARLTVTGEHSIAVTVTDDQGGLVASAAELVIRDVDAGDLIAPVPRGEPSLFRLAWIRADDPGAPGVLPSAVLLDGAGLADPERLLAEAREYDRDADLVVLPVRTDSDAGIEDVHQVLHSVLRVVQAWTLDPQWASSRLVFATRSAISADPADDTAVDVVAGAVSGLLRTAIREYPGQFALVDLDPEVPWADGLAAVPVSIVPWLELGEAEFVIRGGETHYPRLVELADDTVAPATEWNAEGTVLITGGTGGLGAQVARHLVTERSVRRLLLASRSGLAAPGAEQLREELTALGARVDVRACDVSDREALADLLAQVNPVHPLTAVIHTAGVLDDATIGALGPDQLDHVLGAKADGAWYLHELTLERNLAAFVVFSSLSGVLGNAGQANYAAANTFLDALVCSRQTMGLPALSLAWGPWTQEAGATGELTEHDMNRMSRRGFPAMSVEQGLAMFSSALDADQPVVVATAFDLAAVRDSGEPAPPALRLLARSVVRRTVGSASPGSNLITRLRAAEVDDRLDLLVAAVREQTAAVLGYDTAVKIGADRNFQGLGFDSLSAVELRTRLSAELGIRLSPTLIFDHPTPTALARFLQAETFGQEVETHPGPDDVPEPVADDPIAIVGMACRLPGGIASPDQLWELVRDEVDAVGEFPSDRGWDLNALAAASATSSGGFIEDPATFDAAFFEVSPREALSMDPQHRLLLESSWEALEDAGITPGTLRGSRTGVFTGLMYHDYASILPATAELMGLRGNGSTGSMASGRVAYSFGFEGPAVTVDTACSSSLVA